MSSFSEAYERIRFATNTRTQVELANILEIRQSSISDAKRRKSIPADWFIKLFDKYGLNPDWLRLGFGPMYLRTEQGYIPQEGPKDGLREPVSAYNDMSRHTVVPVYNMSCDYIDGERPELALLERLALPLPCMPEGRIVFRMNATNMEPVLCQGAYFAVDTRETRPVSGMLYALFAPGEGIVVRRVFSEGDQSQYLLRSESAAFPESRLLASLLPSRIVGKVIWLLQKIS